MKKYILMLFAVALLSFMISGVSADEKLAVPTLSELESGIYTVKNVASDNNLNAFDFAYSSGGYAYTDVQSGEEGENILLLRQEDGTYLMYPQSEAGRYAFCIIEDSEKIHVGKSEEITSASYFRIAVVDGVYVIYAYNGMALCGISGEKLHRKELVLGHEYQNVDSQKWEFTPVELSHFELKTVAEEVKLYSISSVYAITKPAYMKNLVQWSSSDESMLMIDDDGSFCALREGVATVTATIGDLTQSIDVKIVDDESFTWYSQHLTKNGGWHADELSGVYFYYGRYKRFIINGYNRGHDWMDEGCFITSIAMVLNNLGARYDSGYDFRFEADGNLEVDPYVVALANSGNTGLTTASGTLYNNPVLVRYAQIEKSFSLHGQPIEIKRTYGVTKKKLKEMLDKHPEGVIVDMVNYANGSHYIVVTDCLNPEETNPNNYKFAIYDSAGVERIEGDDVAFEKSISYETLRYRYSHMRSMFVFDIIATEE